MRRFGNDFRDWRSRSENHCRIVSGVTKQSVFMATHILFYFLRAISCFWTHRIREKQSSIAYFAIVARDGVSNLALWCHHCWSVTSRKRELLVLWCHVHRLFVRVPIGAKAIFTIYGIHELPKHYCDNKGSLSTKRPNRAVLWRSREHASRNSLVATLMRTNTSCKNYGWVSVQERKTLGKVFL